MITVARALETARQALTDPDSGRLDAELLLAHVMGRNRTWLHTWPESPVDDDIHETFLDLVAHRRRGKPIAYLTGMRAFHAIDVSVTPAVLIPRPETELLVDHVLAESGPESRHILELGTGSGCIALAIATARPTWQVTATDVSAEALELARDNARRLHTGNVDFLQGDWFAPVTGMQFDAIVSNPPYVAENDPHLQRGDLRFEPRAALAAGPLGLDDLSRIIAEAPGFLRSGGLLTVEHGMDQGDAVARLFREAGLVAVETKRDLAGLPRITSGRSAP